MCVCVCLWRSEYFAFLACNTPEIYFDIQSTSTSLYLCMSEWIIQEKNNIDDCWVSTQALNRIELNCRNFPFPSFCCRRHRLSLSLFPSIRHDDEWGKLSWFTSFHSHRFASALSTKNRSLSSLHPSTHRDLIEMNTSATSSFTDAVVALTAARGKRWSWENIKYRASYWRCCAASMAASKLMMIFNRPIVSRARDDDESFPCSFGNNAKVKRISQLEKTLFSLR